MINMDQTCVYFNCAIQTKVHRKGERTISRLTLCLEITVDGTKLPLFVAMKGQPSERIEKRLHELLPTGVF